MESQTVMLEVIYDAPVEKVWRALTDKSQLQQWYFDIPEFNTAPGSSFDFYEGPERKYHHQCTVTALLALQKFQHTWTHPQQSKGSSLLTWELFPRGVQTRVRLTHSGLEQLADGGPAFAKANYEQGWNEIMNKLLRSFLEH